MRNYTDKSYWNKYWDKEKRENIQFYFDVLLDQYIVWENVKSYMEVGGAPGSIMAYMYRKHNLKVFTIDFSERERIENYLDYQQIKDYYIYTQDFQSFSTNENKEKYDIVASWGFIEHFEKDITTNFIEKKKQMVSEGGYLIVVVPQIGARSDVRHNSTPLISLFYQNNDTLSSVPGLSSKVPRGAVGVLRMFASRTQSPPPSGRSPFQKGPFSSADGGYSFL